MAWRPKARRCALSAMTPLLCAGATPRPAAGRGCSDTSAFRTHHIADAEAGGAMRCGACRALAPLWTLPRLPSRPVPSLVLVLTASLASL